MAKSKGAQTPEIMTLEKDEELRNELYLQGLSDKELADKISRAENLLVNLSKLPDGGARLLLHLKRQIAERERRNHLKTRLTEATVDPFEVDPDGLFLSMAHMKKDAFGTGSYGKTANSSCMSCSSTTSPFQQNDPRVDELQTEVKVLKDQMRQIEERTNRLEAMLQMFLTQQQQDQDASLR
ncbi:hypothetical protein CASFOL_023494 [Castilleja foliolosa]|uniref:Uncharacterized protein n=1 Tax=Castilleja foliolosa TaxID=1961234 RepID=A0ABD3CKQ4_9LAMI